MRRIATFSHSSLVSPFSIATVTATATATYYIHDDAHVTPLPPPPGSTRPLNFYREQGGHSVGSLSDMSRVVGESVLTSAAIDWDTMLGPSVEEVARHTDKQTRTHTHTVHTHALARANTRTRTHIGAAGLVDRGPNVVERLRRGLRVLPAR